MTLVEVVRNAVAKAYEATWNSPCPVETLDAAVRHPRDTPREAEFNRALCVIFCEYAGLSQYGPRNFWRVLNDALAEHGLYYEWLDGGTATIWPA